VGVPLVLGVSAILLIAAELFVLVQIVHVVGVVPTVALLIIVPMFGIRLIHRQGSTVLRRLQSHVAERRLPGPALLDGLLLAVAGALLVVPGFITDALGLLLLIPPVRAVANAILRWTLRRRIGVTALEFRR
jgi:UPF0716 protein FxsA